LRTILFQKHWETVNIRQATSQHYIVIIYVDGVGRKTLTIDPFCKGKNSV